uniref:Uncharacterized protein LOC101242954 n=1 Tax=Phallusia mammillata TaxID=59560 RepID=A0A6F9DI62_9ASCI|nr:uncharacterized protein LOC101242954 [Phallusia mammillata]
MLSLRTLRLLAVMLKVIFLLIFATVIISADYVSLRKCPTTGDRTQNICGETCMAMKEYNLPRINRGDRIDLRRAEMILLGRRVYTKCNKTFSWWFNDDVKHIKSNISDIKLTLYFVPYGHNLSRPGEATCCGVPLTQKSCTFDVKERGKLYFGLMLNKDMFGVTSFIHEFSTPVETCNKIANKTYVCTSQGIIKFKEYSYSHTNAEAHGKDVITKALSAKCHTVPRETVMEFGVELGQHIAKDFFNRQIWNITGYHGDTTNCSVDVFDVARNVTVNVTDGDLVCYLYEADDAKMNHFCMPGKEATNNKPIGMLETTDIGLVVGFSALGLILLVIIVCLGRKFGKNAKKEIMAWRKIPENIVKMGNTLENKPTELPPMDDKEIPDTFVPGEVTCVALPSPAENNRDEEIGLLKSEFIKEDRAPRAGDYIQRNESLRAVNEDNHIGSCMGIDTELDSSSDESSLTSTQYAQMRTSKQSSESSDSNNVDTGNLNSCPGKIDLIFPLQCVEAVNVSGLALNVEDIDGPVPGTEEQIFQTLFLKLNETSLTDGVH